jgi:hypothetical protein
LESHFWGLLAIFELILAFGIPIGNAPKYPIPMAKSKRMPKRYHQLCFKLIKEIPSNFYKRTLAYLKNLEVISKTKGMRAWSEFGNEEIEKFYSPNFRHESYLNAQGNSYRIKRLTS